MHLQFISSFACRGPPRGAHRPRHHQRLAQMNAASSRWRLRSSQPTTGGGRSSKDDARKWRHHPPIWSTGISHGPPLRPPSAFSAGRNSALPRAFSARSVVFTTCTQARSHQNPDPMRQENGGEEQPGGAPERRPLLRRGLRDGVCTLWQGQARVQGGPRQRRPPPFIPMTPQNTKHPPPGGQHRGLASLRKRSCDACQAPGPLCVQAPTAVGTHPTRRRTCGCICRPFCWRSLASFRKAGPPCALPVSLGPGRP